MARLWVIFSNIVFALPWCTGGLVSPIIQQSSLDSLADNVRGTFTNSHGGIGQPQPFGVGMDLSSGYGTVSISYANGSRVDIAKIEGKPAYARMLTKWSLVSSQHLAPPYTNMPDEMKDSPRQQRRRERKARGLPASEDVEILSTMLKALRTAAESHLGHGLDSTLAATPNLVALYREDIEDAFEYVGLKSLDNDNYLIRLFHETMAAAAGNGLGLCRHYADASSCIAENSDMPLRYVVSVLYTKTSLCVERIVMRSVYNESPFPASPPSMDFELGSNKLHSNPDEQYYWEAVKDTIWRGIIADSNVPDWPSEIFVFGESAQDPTFRKHLDEALIALMGRLPKIFDKSPLFQAAQGAAEIARRGGYYRLWPKEVIAKED